MPNYYELRPAPVHEYEDYGRKRIHVPLHLQPATGNLYSDNQSRLKPDDDRFDGFVDSRMHSCLNMRNGTANDHPSDRNFYDRNVILTPASNLTQPASFTRAPAKPKLLRRKRPKPLLKDKAVYPPTDSDSFSSATDKQHVFGTRNFPVYHYKQSNVDNNKYLPKRTPQYYRCSESASHDSTEDFCNARGGLASYMLPAVLSDPKRRPRRARSRPSSDSLHSAHKGYRETSIRDMLCGLHHSDSSTRKSKPRTLPERRSATPLSSEPNNACCSDVEKRVLLMEKKLTELEGTQNAQADDKKQEEQEADPRSTPCVKRESAASCHVEPHGSTHSTKRDSMELLRERPPQLQCETNCSERKKPAMKPKHSRTHQEHPPHHRHHSHHLHHNQPHESRSRRGKALTVQMLPPIEVPTTAVYPSSDYRSNSYPSYDSYDRSAESYLSRSKSDSRQTYGGSGQSPYYQGTSKGYDYSSAPVYSGSSGAQYTGYSGYPRSKNRSKSRSGSGSRSRSRNRNLGCCATGCTKTQGAPILAAKASMCTKPTGSPCPPSNKGYRCGTSGVNCGNFAGNPIEVGYAVTIVTRFHKYTVYEVLRPSTKKPPALCRVTENVFVVKNERSAPP